MTRLESSPSILPLYLKAAMPLIPGASSLPFLPGGGGEIPSGLGFELKGVVPQQDQVAEYAKVCGFPLKDRLPPTFPHVLAFPLHMAVMSNGEFPFGAVGLVHIENSINQLRPIAFGEMLEVKVEVTSLSPHPKGQIFSLLTEVSAAGETVWTETSTMLRRGKGSKKPSAPGLEIPTLDPGTPASATWKLPADLGRRYERRYGGACSLVLLDLDRFKAFNDTHGHAAGNALLTRVGQEILVLKRESDLAARFGGEEFVVLLRAPDSDRAEVGLERFRRAVQTYAFPRVGSITVSIGFADIRVSDTPTAAFERADKAVYHAKQNGRNQVAGHAELVQRGVFQEDRHEGDVELF